MRKEIVAIPGQQPATAPIATRHITAAIILMLCTRIPSHAAVLPR